MGRDTRKRNTKSSKSANVHTDPFFEPLVRRVYNTFMGGVDGHDQLRSYFHIRLKRMKRWWVPVWMADVDMAVVNALICYWGWQKMRGEKKRITHEEFRYQIVESIIEQYCQDAPDMQLRDVYEASDGIRRMASRAAASPASAPASADKPSAISRVFNSQSPPAPAASPVSNPLPPVPLAGGERHYAVQLEEVSSSARRTTDTVKHGERSIKKIAMCSVCKDDPLKPPVTIKKSATETVRNPDYGKWARARSGSYVCKVCWGSGTKVPVCLGCILKHEDKVNADSRAGVTPAEMPTPVRLAKRG